MNLYDISSLKPIDRFYLHATFYLLIVVLVTNFLILEGQFRAAVERQALVQRVEAIEAQISSKPPEPERN